MYEELIARVNRSQAEFAFELARTNDPYRLEHLLLEQVSRLELLRLDVNSMVRELEELDDI